MKIYVSASAYRDGDGTQARPFKHINDAAKVARPGDEVLVAPAFTGNMLTPRTPAPRTPASPTAAPSPWAR